MAWDVFDWRYLGLGFAIGWCAGWWRHRPAARHRREALATIERTGRILRDEIARVEDEIAREKRRGQKHNGH